MTDFLNIHKPLLRLLAFLVIFTLSGCRKDNVCEDQGAFGWEEDGTCTYLGGIIYWWDKAFRDSCQENGIDSIEIFISQPGQYTKAGTLAVDIDYLDAEPDCGYLGGYGTHIFFNEPVITATHYQYFKDSLQNTVKTISFEFQCDGRVCNKVKLIW